MGKGKRLSDDATLVVYSTKVLPTTRLILDAHAKALGHNQGQRVLLDEMLAVYIMMLPERAKIAQELLEIFNPKTAAPVHKALMEKAERMKRGTWLPSDYVEAAESAEKFDQQAPVQGQPKTVTTITYLGKPTVHLAENGRAACGLAGTVDPESIKQQDPTTVDCKKCRYCRKAAFA